MPRAPAAAPFTVFPIDFAIAGGLDGPSPRGGSAELDGERLVLLPPSGPPLPVPLMEVLGIAARDRCLDLLLVSGETLTLSRLGSRFDALHDALVRARNEALLDAYWMREGEAAPPTRAEWSGTPPRPCELRLMETALVLLFADGDPVRLPYALLESIQPEDHTVTLDLRGKGRFRFTGFGRAFEPFVDALSKAANGLHAAHLDLLRRTLPDLDPAALRNAAGLLRDGVAVPMTDLERAGLWRPLCRAAAAGGPAGELAALFELAGPAGPSAGVKRGLAGELSGDYLFFLAPITPDGCAAVLESVRLGGPGEEAEGRATYLFRLDGDPGSALDVLNSDLLDLNFRREPLLVPEGKLPRRRPAPLDALRGRLLGRAMHRSFEGWKAEVLALARAAGKGTP